MIKFFILLRSFYIITEFYSTFQLMSMEEMTKSVQKLEELDALIEQAREEADVCFWFWSAFS